jgi:hypothetical protein
MTFQVGFSLLKDYKAPSARQSAHLDASLDALHKDCHEPHLPFDPPPVRRSGRHGRLALLHGVASMARPTAMEQLAQAKKESVTVASARERTLRPR